MTCTAPQGGRTRHLPPVTPRRPELALTSGSFSPGTRVSFAKLHIQKHFAEMGVLRSFTTGKSTFFMTVTGSVGHAKDLWSSASRTVVPIVCRGLEGDFL